VLNRETSSLDEDMIDSLKGKKKNSKIKPILFCCCLLVFILHFWNRHGGAFVF